MVKYIAHYDLPTARTKRNVSLSAANKIRYIVDSISSCEKRVDIYSACNTLKEPCKKETIRIDNNVSLHLMHGFRRGNCILNKLSTILFLTSYFFFLLFHLHKKDMVIVYHSLALMKTISILKAIKRFRLIIEAEEVYSDVTNNLRKRKKEIKFFNRADAFLFPSELMNTIINTKKKPSAIVYGSYQVEEDKRCGIKNESANINNDRIFDCVYAGTLDPRKGGAEAAARAAEFLPENYHIHILGFGKGSDLKRLQDVIDETVKKSKAKVTYDGLLSGEDYIRFIQSCDIGLSTQDPSAAFNATSFPSKVLSYMTNGLRVVCIRIPAVEQAAIGNYIWFYDKQEPREIAHAIQRAAAQKGFDSRSIIAELDQKFKTEIGILLDLDEK